MQRDPARPASRHAGSEGVTSRYNDGASTPTECHFTALRYFALNGTDHRNHEEQNSMIRRYIAWRNRHSDNEELRASSLRAEVA
jgi:hypothetical protein